MSGKTKHGATSVVWKRVPGRVMFHPALGFVPAKGEALSSIVDSEGMLTTRFLSQIISHCWTSDQETVSSEEMGSWLGRFKEVGDDVVSVHRVVLALGELGWMKQRSSSENLWRQPAKKRCNEHSLRMNRMM